MIKRIISILLVFASLFGVLVIPTAFATTNTQNELEFLNTLGIINTNVDKPEDIVTREMMALYVARMLKIDENQKSEIRYFTDVEHLGFSATAINALVTQRIISIPENRLFNPGNYITQNETLKMLVCATGYETYAVEHGGWPLGYIKAAERAGFNLVCKNPNAITINEVGKMIYEALCAPMYTKSVVGTTEIMFEADADKTILTEYWDIYRREGTVRAVYGGSTEKNMPALEENRVFIDDTEYTVSLDVYEKLGSYVDFFYESETDGDGGNIVYIFSKNIKKPEIQIEFALFAGFENETVSYYKDAQSKRLSKIVMNDPVIIYNGSILGSGVEAALSNLNKGSITLKDSDNNGDYDVLLIEDYKNFVVSGIDIEGDKIYNKLNSKETIVCRDYDAVIIQDELGNKITKGELLIGQVLSVAYSKDKRYIKVITSKQSVVGVLTAMKDKNDEFRVTIGDTEYSVDKTYVNEFKNFCNVGREYTFMLDNFGNIALVTDELNSSFTYGYIIGASYEDFIDEMELKILTQSGEIKIMACDKKLIIDGDVYKLSDGDIIESLLIGEDEKIRGQLVRYSVKDEKVNKIDTRRVSTKEADTNSMYRVFTEERQSHWYNSYNLGRKAILKTSTPVFYIPNDFNTAIEENFYLGTAAAGLKNDKSYTADAYKNSSLNGFADAVVVYYDATSDMGGSGTSKKIFIVDKIEEGLYEDEVVTIVEGFENSSAKTVYVPSEIDLSGVEQGDVLAFTYDIKGNVMKSTENSIGVEVVFDCDKKMPASYSTHWLENNASGHLLYNEGSKTSGNYRSEFQISYGNVVYKKDSIVQWSAKDFGEYTDSGDLSGKIVIVYNELTEKVYTGSFDDIVDYKSAGEDCSKILYVTRGGAGSFAIVYNYK